jgi:hypothetical protein
MLELITQYTGSRLNSNLLGEFEERGDAQTTGKIGDDGGSGDDGQDVIFLVFGPLSRNITQVSRKMGNNVDRCSVHSGDLRACSWAEAKERNGRPWKA